MGLVGDGGSEPLLPSELLARLEGLQLRTGRRLAGRYSGEHRSRRYGTSLDFADFREYHPGDDFRRIDYHLYARLDVLLLRLFEAEDDLTVRLLVDSSGSMASGASLRTAQRVAAAIGFVALVNRDAVTLATLGETGPPQRFAGRSAVPALFRCLEDLTAAGTTDLVAAAVHLLGRRSLPGVTVLVSDLLSPEWEPAISRLPARGDQVVVVHVIEPAELDPDLMGDLELVDVESGERVAVSLSPESRKAHRRRVEQWLEAVASRCRQVGAVYLPVSTDEDLEQLLLGRWRQEGVLG